MPTENDSIFTDAIVAEIATLPEDRRKAAEALIFTFPQIREISAKVGNLTAGDLTAIRACIVKDTYSSTIINTDQVREIYDGILKRVAQVEIPV